ncbi:MAG: DUF1697 domain-containing protein [Candidatus Dormibacteraeota bacterium]|nr:DUF1697 domain-containing protein [Candidatus Dormibacteraeota bacterium]
MPAARRPAPRTRYVALLRGVNVGGKGIVSMAALAETFRGLGFEDVRTYLNSGNVIFSARPTPVAQLGATIEPAIERDTGLPVSVLVLDDAAVRSVVQALPTSWVTDATVRTDVLFLWPDVDDPGVLERIPRNPEVDDVRYTPGALLWRIDRVNAGRSRETRLVGSALYKRMTIRNANTARTLHKLLSA